MSTGIYSAASVMKLEMKRQEVIAQNLASSNIAGYKREFLRSSRFQNELKNELTTKENETDSLYGTSKGTTHIDLTQGAFKQTSRTLDFAIEGDGFFEVKNNDGEIFYTRNGNFKLTQDKELITSEGYKVLGESGNITFSPDDNIQNIHLSQNGTITILDESGSNKTIGQLRIVGLNTSNLKRVTSSYFKTPYTKINSLTEDKFKVINNALEISNSSPIKEMVGMVQSMREFEIGQKVLKMISSRFQKEQIKLTK